MARTVTVSDRILEIMRRDPDCHLDKLVLSCGEFSWQEVLIGVHRLSEKGRLQLVPISFGSCAVRLIGHHSPSLR